MTDIAKKRKRRSDPVDTALKVAAAFFFALAAVIFVMLVWSAATGRVYHGDVCSFRSWGHCAGR